MKIEKSSIEKVLLLIFSIGCVVGSIRLYLFKEECNAQVKDLKEAEQESALQEDPMEAALTEKMELQLTKTREQLDEWQMKLDSLQQEYDFLVLLGKNANESASDDARVKLEKYFQIRQGELARIQGIESSEMCGAWGFLNSHMGGITLAVDEGVDVQYYNSAPSPILEYLLPDSLIIMSYDLDLGFMRARAGMNFEEIQENAYETELHTGFMYNEDNEIYYIEYFDDYYEYRYVSDQPDGSDSWVVISHL